jgi:hypothetical protein
MWQELEIPIYNTNRFGLQECGDFTWRVSDCEELVGVTHGDDGVGFRVYS